MVMLLQKGDLSPTHFTNDDTANEGGVAVKLGAGTPIQSAIDSSLTNVVTGKIGAGSNITITGSGTNAAPYVISTPDEVVTTIAIDGNHYKFTNELGNTTTLLPGQFVSTDAGNSIQVGTDGRLHVLIPAQLPDDQVFTGDGSGTVHITLTPEEDSADPTQTNYTIKADVKVAGGDNGLVWTAGGFFVEVPLLELSGSTLSLSTGGSVSLPVPDGSETKIGVGARLGLTGTGTTADPYALTTAASEVTVTDVPGFGYDVGTVNVNGTAIPLRANVPVAAVGVTGTVDLSNKQFLGNGSKVVNTTFSKRVADVVTFNLDLGDVFTRTITANTTFAVQNVPVAGLVACFALDLTNGGSKTLTWWTGLKWEGGVVPTLTAAGRDILGFMTHDGGVTWNGFILGKDMK